MVLLVAARPSKVTSHLRSTRTLAVGETQLERVEVGSERAVARSEAAEGKVGRTAAGWPRVSSTRQRVGANHLFTARAGARPSEASARRDFWPTGGVCATYISGALRYR